jgi:hypothetical protein
VTEQADQFHASWAYYQYKGMQDYSTQYGESATLGMYKENGKLDENKLNLLTRTYAPAIQGHLSKKYYDINTGIFMLDYNCDMSIDAPTEIFVSKEQHYPQGYKISIQTDL